MVPPGSLHMFDFRIGIVEMKTSQVYPLNVRRKFQTFEFVLKFLLECIGQVNVVVKVSRTPKDRIVDEREVITIQLFCSIGSMMDQWKATGTMRNVM